METALNMIIETKFELGQTISVIGFDEPFVVLAIIYVADGIYYNVSGKLCPESLLEYISEDS